MVTGGMHIRFLFCALAMALTLFSCKKAETEEIVVVKRPKTVLLYMVANNNLSYDAENSISRLQNGYIPAEEELARGGIHPVPWDQRISP